MKHMYCRVQTPYENLDGNSVELLAFMDTVFDIQIPFRDSVPTARIVFMPLSLDKLL